jgi:hypothetical protein
MTVCAKLRKRYIARSQLLQLCANPLETASH